MTKRTPEEIFARRMVDRTGLAHRLLDLVGSIPAPRESRSDDPESRGRSVALSAAAKAASTAGALALPPGPLGWLTIAPELYAVWRIQTQMVADLAGVYDKSERLTRERMLYCLFSHTAASAFSDSVIRVGERYVLREAPLSALYAIANKIAIRLAQRSFGRMTSRWLPVVGALGVAGYVYVDTGRVAAASADLFSAEVEFEDGGSAAADGPGKRIAIRARPVRRASAGEPASEPARKRPARKRVSPARGK